MSGTGATDQVAIFRHPTTTTADNPADPAALPAAFSYPFTTHAQVIAAGSALGGGADSFLDLARAVERPRHASASRATRRVYIWAGSSTVANALDLDLACFGGAGGTLTTIDVGVTAPDPNAPGGGGGGGTGGGTTAAPAGPRTLEGGPGCSVAAGAAPLAVARALPRRARAGRPLKMDPRQPNNDFEFTVGIYNDPADPSGFYADDGKGKVIVYSRCTDLQTLQQRAVQALITVTVSSSSDYTGQAGRGMRNQGNQNF